MSHILTGAEPEMVRGDRRAGPVARLRREKTLLLLLLALAAATWAPRLRGPLDLRWDGGVYYILGTSLAQGKGYTLLNEPGHAAAVQYPPLLPVLIAATQKALGTSDPVVVGQALRSLQMAVFLAYVFAVFALLKGFLPPRYAFLATLAFLFNLYTFFLSDLCFPETLFGLVSVLFFLCHRRQERRTFAALEPVLGAAAFALRTAGIALLAAWVVEALFRKQYKRFFLRALAALVPVICWQAYIARVESSPSYKSPAYAYQRADYQFYNVSYARNISLKDPFSPEDGRLSPADMAVRFLVNAAGMPVSLGEAVSLKRDYFHLQQPPFNKYLFFSRILPLCGFAVLTVLGCLTIGGIAVLLRKRQWMVFLYIAASLAVICTTPWPQQFTRYLAPLTPFLVLCLFLGLLSLRRPRGRAVSRVAMPLAALVLFLQTGVLLEVYLREHQAVTYDRPGGGRVAYRLFFYKEPYRALDRGLDWLRPRAEPGTVVASSGPHWVYLRTGLKAVMPPFERDPVKAQRLLDSVPVRYLLRDKGALDTQKYVDPVLHRFPERWRLIYADLEGEFAIYERTHRPAAAGRKPGKDWKLAGSTR